MLITKDQVMLIRSVSLFVVPFFVLFTACGKPNSDYKKSVDKAGDRAVEKQSVDVSLPSGTYKGTQRVVLRLEDKNEKMDILVEDKPGLETVECTSFEKADKKATCMLISESVEVSYYVTLEIDRPDLYKPWKKKKKGYAGEPKVLNYVIEK